MSNKYVTLGQLIKNYMLPMCSAPFCKALKEVKSGKLRQKGELYSELCDSSGIRTSLICLCQFMRCYCKLELIQQRGILIFQICVWIPMKLSMIEQKGQRERLEHLELSTGLKMLFRRNHWQRLLTRQTNYKEMALQPNISIMEFYCLRDYILESCAQPFSYQTYIRQAKQEKVSNLGEKQDHLPKSSPCQLAFSSQLT